MNVVKIQQDLIKDVLNDKGHNYFIQVKDSEVIIFTKYQVYVLDPKEWLLDKDKLIAKGVKESTTADKVLNGSDDAKPAHRTGKLKLYDKSTLLELKREDNDELVYLDEKLLKLYDKSAEFEATDHKSPVYVYENDILVGVVLPFKVL